MRWIFCVAMGLVGVSAAVSSQTNAADLQPLESLSAGKPRNVVFVLADDHRYDAMGFMGHPFLETPNMDRIAREGVHFGAAYATTALCSPSRASILTGQYAHTHRVVDNNQPCPEGTIFFPQYLQQAGYETAFFGKWHMGGESDEPRPGFDRWVSFRGQGTYLPSKSGLNVDGVRVPQKGYITDELTQYCVDWLNSRTGEKPFFIYLSHKAVHAEFMPAERHKGRYADAKWVPPESMALSEENFKDKPRWVKDQRNSWHGVDFAYHSRKDIEKYYKQYCETLLAVDESLGAVMNALEARGLLDETMVIYMGDNGFCFGEHGLIDKRTAYEASMRVPMIARCPALFQRGQTCQSVVANIDIAPTVLEIANLKQPAQMQGQSFLGLLTGKQTAIRDALLYEYYWERNFPQTPTMHAIRTADYKLILYHGIWDTDELYDIRHDPHERRNLINDPAYAKQIQQLRRQLYAELQRTGGMNIPLYPDQGRSNNKRSKAGSQPGDFPSWFYLEPEKASK